MTDVFDDIVDEATLAKSWNRGQGCSVRTLARYRNQRDGLPYIEIGGRIFYKLESVRKWIESCERRPNPRRAA